MTTKRFQTLALVMLAMILIVGAWAIWQWKHSPEQLEKASLDATERYYRDHGEKFDPNDLSSDVKR